MSDEEGGGRIFFSSVRRSLEIEDEITLVTVGVDIGSSTSHLVFSRLLLERLDNRYIVSQREVLYESEVLLTPYADDLTIDAEALGAFIERQYQRANIAPDAIDTGALILTGVAVRRSNARAIADLFAAQAGKFVSVSAGDALEATLAAFGSGAAARSIRETARVMNIDVGGGTTKIAVCEQGAVVELTAMDVGARVLSFDRDRRLTRIEEAGRFFARQAHAAVELGDHVDDDVLDAIAERMADHLFQAVSSATLSPETESLMRLETLRNERRPEVVIFSGGVSEYVYDHERAEFGDLGPRLARAIRARVSTWGPRIEPPDQGIRATVVGASQYTIQ
ncbi:MAG TPA: ethanolamine ammonia-lyase reactivating factor EutA, partial [Vicinamibacterales bacterium]|nr:ethanolamine ammonia-lyase reactivating factor EutA [Vicinamibacterales bacterium]